MNNKHKNKKNKKWENRVICIEWLYILYLLVPIVIILGILWVKSLSVISFIG